MARTRFTIDEVLCHFEELEDPRSEINRKHPLESVIVIAILGVLAQASGPTGIATWAKFHAEFLQSLLPLPNGVPGKDVFRRVLCALKPDVFQQCFANWIKTLRADAAQATEIDQHVGSRWKDVAAQPRREERPGTAALRLRVGQ